MSLKLPNLDHLPPDERIAKLREIEAFLLEIVYSKVLPNMPLAQQIETLQTIERLGKHAQESTPTNTDDGMLADVLAEAEEILS